MTADQPFDYRSYSEPRLTARQRILNLLTGRAACPAPRPVDEAEQLLDAYQTETLAQRAVPASAGGDLRARIAQALEEADYRMDMRRGDLADAVLAVLPKPVDQTAEIQRIRAERDEMVRQRNQIALHTMKAILAPADAPAELAPMFEGIARLLATSRRDMGQHYADAWLYAIFLGWDCEKTEHDETCVHGAMEEIAADHGWDAATVAKVRRYRAAVRRTVDQTGTPTPADQTATPASTAPLAAGLPLVKGRCPACGTAGLFLGDGGYVTCSLIGCPEPDAATTVLERGKGTAPVDRAAVLREAYHAIAALPKPPNPDAADGMREAAEALRRMADEAQQAELEAPRVAECANCRREIENRSEPNMGGPARDNWVHLPGGYTICHPQQPNSPRAEPAEQEPVQLRWGLDDVMYGDDDTTAVMLSGPAREPYWLELAPERAAALRAALAGPDRAEERAEPEETA
ncbi:hypothetical protein [Streptomyces sp. NPDC046821]|uniref:hypothetical protein n=1 Tax=Streptomyces sp. NPDC046821 TaxID=3154702 RepID=UPI0033D68290